MDNLENNPPAQAPAYPLDPEAGASAAACESLRQVVLFLLVLVLLVSGTFNFFLLRQVKSARQQLDAVRQQVNGIAAQFNQNLAPTMDEFLRRVSDFGRTNADYKAVLERYFSKMGSGGTPGLAPAAALAPGPLVSPPRPAAPAPPAGNKK
jgi:hypothetical protein